MSSEKSNKSTVRSEDELGLKWDRCLSNTALKTGGGLIVGLVLSVFLLKKRPWPIALGTGIGLGMGYSDCQHDFKQPYLLHGHRVKVRKEDSAKTLIKSNEKL